MAKRKENTIKQDWNKISGIVRIWGRETGNKKKSWIQYSTGIGIQDEKGNWSNMYFNVKFTKEAGTPANIDDGDNGYINITRGFLSFHEYKGVQYPDIVVQGWKEVEE